MDITCLAYTFTIDTPYAEGHIVSAAEARVLNIARRDILRDKMARAVRQLERAHMGKLLPFETLKALQQRMDEWCGKFAFPASDMTAPKTAISVHRELRQVAYERVIAQFKQAGVMNPSKAAIDAAIIVQEGLTQVQEEARERVRSKLALADKLMKELIGDDEE